MNQINPDSVLTEEEVKAAKDAFDAYDKMGYGTLEVEELQKILEEFGHKATKEELNLMIQQVDPKNKGYIGINMIRDAKISRTSKEPLRFIS